MYSLSLFLLAFCSIYTQLKGCVEISAGLSKCLSRGFLVDEFFVKVHEMYFSDCGLIQDPPLLTLVLLIAPVTIVTLFLPLLCTYLTPQDASVIWMINFTNALLALHNWVLSFVMAALFWQSKLGNYLAGWYVTGTHFMTEKNLRATWKNTYVLHNSL